MALSGMTGGLFAVTSTGGLTSNSSRFRFDEEAYNREFVKTTVGCQASRVPPNIQVDFGWVGQKLKQAAARFAHVPPIFVHSK